jgi:release factor glutamine methyltransferase
VTVAAGGVRASVADATARLAGAGVPNAHVDAEILAAFVLGVDRGRQVALGWPAQWPPGKAAEFQRLVRHRVAREPLQYLLGTAPFRHLELQVGPGVFIPRPETELVAGEAIDELGRRRGRGLVVDLGTGSGAIALSIAQECPAATVHAVERDSAALAWAQRNQVALGLPVAMHHGDIAEVTAVLPDLLGQVDVVVCNPPYLPEGLTLEAEVADHDPAGALWGGPDGLSAMRLVEHAGRELLAAGGLLVIEHDASHQDGVLALLNRWDDPVGHRDLAGRDRYVTARLPAGDLRHGRVPG